MEEIEVQCADEEPVIFPCRCWLAEDEGDGKTARVLVPGETIQPQLDSKENNTDCNRCLSSFITDTLRTVCVMKDAMP